MRLGDFLLTLWDGDHDTDTELVFEDREGKRHVIEGVEASMLAPELVFVEGGYEPPEHPA